MNNTTAS